MHWLDDNISFPHPFEANEDGIVALGGDLSPERLILAYRKGIFPWFNDGDIPMWWSPNPRSVLYTNEIKISKSMRNILNRGMFHVTVDTAFEKVIRKCRISRVDKEGTWITEDIIRSYVTLHNLGFAHSVEVWQENELVGGLYGVSMGNMFFGESMFSQVSNASKVGFIFLANKLNQFGFKIIDCQIQNPHLESMGAVEIAREEFLVELNESLSKCPIIEGNWTDYFLENI